MSEYAYASKFNYDVKRDGRVKSNHRRTCNDFMGVIFNGDSQQLWRCRSCGVIARHSSLMVDENPAPEIKEFTLPGDILP